MFSWDVIGFEYDGSIHCIYCAIRRFGSELLSDTTHYDSRGQPVMPVFADQDYSVTFICIDCLSPLAL